MKRLGGVVALALVVAACGDSGLTEGAEGGDVTVTNHPALLFSPPWIAAQNQQLFEKNGLNVKQIVGSEGGGTTVRNVVSGGLPIGEVATTAAISAYMAGADIRIVGGGVASSRDTFLNCNGSGAGGRGFADGGATFAPADPVSGDDGPIVSPTTASSVAAPTKAVPIASRG